LAVTDRLALRVYIVNSVIGRTIINHTQDSHLCQVITTFSSGVSSINGLTKQTQYLAVGTSGTDFAINSATDTHTFNLPTASATNRGALSSANWSTFNGKQNAITLTTTGTGAATLVADTLNIPTPTSGITVGTTAVTSGTVGRVFFQGTGDVVQQDAGFLFDATAKTLTNYGKGAIATNTSFGLQVFENITSGFQNSAFGVRALQKITTSNYNVAFGSTGDSNSAFGHGSLSASTSGISNSAFGVSAGNTITSGYGNIVIGASSTTGITTGTFNTLVGCNITGLATSTSNSVILTDGNGMSGIALWKNASNFVGIGYNPTTATLGAKLDVKAQGALSTDIAFRVRNSADTANLAYVSGNGLAIIGVNASSSPTLIIDPSGSARATLRGGPNQSILLNSSGWNNLNGGSGGWDIEATGGEIRQRNGSNYTLLSGNFFGIGRTPSARLDVQAQGATVTDLALRVRNSADTNNLFLVKGNGVLNAPNLPTSAVGLVTGDIWNNLGILTIV
jgi:hypothetical protein